MEHIKTYIKNTIKFKLSLRNFWETENKFFCKSEQ